jgi:50S ribosomal protein L16 3-hydroxylase
MLGAVEVLARPQLADLIAPLTPDGFLAENWTAGRPHLSRPDLDLVERVKSIAALRSVEALIPRHRQDIRVFGPRGFRSVVAPRAALDFLSQGYNLYITGVEETVPESRELLSDVARDLRMAPWQLHVEAFAGRAGGVSSRHYDHDVNFQLLLDGEKEWLLEENRNIDNPLQSFHPSVDRSGAWSGLREEAYASDPAMPPVFDPARSERFHATAGTTVFLPRGWWHETRSLTDTWSINLVLRSTTWARALGKALEIHLHRDPEFRAWCGGVPDGGLPLPAPVRAQRLETFADLKEAAVAALRRLTMDEAVLSLLAFIPYSYRWASRAAARGVIERPDGWALDVPGLLAEPLPVDEGQVAALRSLCALVEPFTWSHVRGLAHELDAADLHALVTSLVAAGLLEVRG